MCGERLLVKLISKTRFNYNNFLSEINSIITVKDLLVVWDSCLFLLSVNHVCYNQYQGYDKCRS